LIGVNVSSYVAVGLHSRGVDNGWCGDRCGWPYTSCRHGWDLGSSRDVLHLAMVDVIHQTTHHFGESSTSASGRVLQSREAVLLHWLLKTNCWMLQ
jgi:hypothetical protein